jgi:hypothetical protein
VTDTGLLNSDAAQQTESMSMQLALKNWDISRFYSVPHNVYEDMCLRIEVLMAVTTKNIF